MSNVTFSARARQANLVYSAQEFHHTSSLSNGLLGYFLLLSILSLPLITLNYFGRAYDLSDTRDWRDLARPSLGNLLPDTIVNNSDTGTVMGARETYIVNSTTVIVITVPLCLPTEQYLSFF